MLTTQLLSGQAFHVIGIWEGRMVALLDSAWAVAMAVNTRLTGFGGVCVGVTARFGRRC